MRKLIYAAIAILGMASAVSAQMTPRSVVTTAPERILLTLSNSTLLDLLDYYESGVQRQMPNKLEEDASIAEMTESTVTVKTGIGRNVTFAILPYGKSNIIMTIDRVETPSADAVISFYDSKWNQFAADKMIKLPKLADWTGALPADKMADIENALPFLMVDAQFDPATSILTFRPQLGDYVSVEEKDNVAAALAPQLKYLWTGKTFKKIDR